MHEQNNTHSQNKQREPVTSLIDDRSNALTVALAHMRNNNKLKECINSIGYIL